MAWFKVDDGLHAHRKTRRVRRSHPEKVRDVSPFGLWVLAGSWCGSSGTGGFVPTEVLEEWDDDAERLALRLVDAGLWSEDEVDGEPGYRFNGWGERNPISEVDAGKFGNHLRWHVNRAIVSPDCDLCVAATRPDDRGDSGTTSQPESSPAPSRPDPTPSSDRQPPAVDENFESFWALYPRREDKGHAVKAWRAASKKATPEVILAGLTQHVAGWKRAHTTRKFIPMPATWLNGERWTDEQPADEPDDPYAHIPYVGQG